MADGARRDAGRPLVNADVAMKQERRSCRRLKSFEQRVKIYGQQRTTAVKVRVQSVILMCVFIF